MFQFMKKTVKPWNLALASVAIASGFLSPLEAIQISSKMYQIENLPEEYKKLCDGGKYQTIVELDQWPANSEIEVYVSRLSAPKIKKLGILNVERQKPVQGISSLGYLPAEPVILSYRDSKKKIDEKITVFPNPLYTKSPNDNAIVEAKLYQLEPIAYNVEFRDFKEGEEVLIKSSSYHESLEQKCKVDKLNFMYMPGVLGKEGGIARLEFIRSSGEILSLELPWGLECIKYQLFYDKDGKVKSIVENEEYRKKNPKVARYFDTNLKA